MSIISLLTKGSEDMASDAPYRMASRSGECRDFTLIGATCSLVAALVTFEA
jgi:hypothetical protein